MTNHKRFWVFTFARYYPDGGLNDLSSTQDTLEDAIATVNRYEPQGFESVPTNAQILDTHDGRIVATWDETDGWDHMHVAI